MAATHTNTSAPFGAVASKRNVSLVASLVSVVAAWNDGRVTRSALGKLTDRELDDIGLTRSDINAIGVSR